VKNSLLENSKKSAGKGLSALPCAGIVLPHGGRRRSIEGRARHCPARSARPL